MVQEEGLKDWVGKRRCTKSILENSDWCGVVGVVLCRAGSLSVYVLRDGRSICEQGLRSRVRRAIGAGMMSESEILKARVQGVG